VASRIWTLGWYQEAHLLDSPNIGAANLTYNLLKRTAEGNSSKNLLFPYEPDKKSQCSVHEKVLKKNFSTINTFHRNRLSQNVGRSSDLQCSTIKNSSNTNSFIAVELSCIQQKTVSKPDLCE
jgi:hypothetical protein